MITTITRYPPTSTEHLCTIAGGIIATLLLAVGAFLLMESSGPTGPDGRAIARGPTPANHAIVTVVERRMD